MVTTYSQCYGQIVFLSVMIVECELRFLSKIMQKCIIQTTSTLLMHAPLVDFQTDDQSDSQRRFGGLTRLYGPEALAAMQHAHVAVVGIGGVGSWAAEALARQGLGALTLIDLDHIAESNINRQVHALSETLGQAKVAAMALRIQSINPECHVTVVDDFLTPDNVSEVLPETVHVVIDCTDQMSAKVAMVLQARARQQALIVCGGAGGKTDLLALRVGDLSEATHDALLARLRNTLRKQHGYSRASTEAGKPRKRVPKMGVRVLWIDQPTILPEAWQTNDSGLQGLSCAGYGSSVTVTASMGLAAAAEAVNKIIQPKTK